MVAATPFRLLVVTPEGLYPQEMQWVSRLFEAGLDTLHLRKPGWGMEQLLAYLHQLDACWHPQIMVHYQPDMPDHVRVKGVHFQQVTLPKAKPDFTVSCPTHSWEEFLAVEDRVDYAFISPFFNSISKKGYGARHQLLEVPPHARRHKAVALGGIDHHTMAAVQQLGLGGAAVLGAVWQTADPLTAFLGLQKSMSYAQ